MSYEANTRAVVGQLEDQAESLSQMAKEVFHNLAVAGPTPEEVAPFLEKIDIEAGAPEGTPKTLLTAFSRARLEMPGIAEGPLEDMTQQELASALQEVVAKYAGSFQYTVLVVTPGKAPILPIAVGIGLAIALIAAFAILRRREVPLEEAPKG